MQFNKIIYILFFFLLNSIYCQNTEVKLVIKDEDTNKPIPEASVLILKTEQTYLTNENGEVKFVLNGNSSIQISHSSYKTKNIRSNLLKDFTIHLKTNRVELDEVIIIKQPQKLLKTLIENSRNKLTLPANLKVYTREFFKKNGTYAYYNDGLLNFQMSNKNKKVESNVLVEQNRSFGTVDEDVSGELLGYNLNNLMENYYSFKYLLPLLEATGKKDYDYVIKIYSKNKQYNSITIVPLDSAKELLDDITIIYEPEKKLIIEVMGEISDATLIKHKEKFNSSSRKIYKSYYKNIYYLDRDYNYYLLSSKEEIGFLTERKGKKFDLQIRNYFITTKFAENNFIYNENQVFKEKTLFNKKNSIFTTYWNVSGLTPTEDEQNIINSLESRSY